MPVGLESAAFGLQPAPGRPEIPGGPQTVARVLDRVLSADPEREALVGRRGRLTYRELDDAANRAAAAFASLGIEPGDRVAACLPNDVDILVAFLGAMRFGAIWVGVNRPLAAPEKAFLLRDSGAVLYLASPDMVEQLHTERADLPELEHVLAADARESDDEWSSLLASQAGASRPLHPVDPFGPAAIAYTSGTTGVPKGAVHSQHNLLLPGAVSRAQGQWPPDVRHGCVLPLTLLNLVVLSPLVAWQAGCCCVAIDRIDPEGLAAWVRDERVGHFAGVPAIFHDLLTHPNVKATDLASLVSPVVGGAECPEEFRALYRERFGAEVAIGYGMTEAPTAVTWSDGEAAAEPGLCGRAVPQVEIEIRDPDSERILAAGESGEICVRPARDGEWAGVYTPMLGYWKQPEATASALRGGVYRTGDLGQLDAGGTLFVRGRRNELILRGGANVYPAEVERVIQDDERVFACAVLGTPDGRLGERVVAAVQLEPGARATAEELLERAGPKLARYKLPERIVFVDDMPRNAMQKIVKTRLASLFAAGDTRAR